MSEPLILTLLVAATTLSAATFGCMIFTARKVSKMSTPEFQKLSADVLELKAEKLALADANKALESTNAAQAAQILDLQKQLSDAQAAVGTSGADVLALDAQVVPALDAPPAAAPAEPAPAGEPAPQAPPAA